MRVRDCMTTDLVTCHPEDSDAHAAQLMWERDCGVLPVVDESDRIVGMVTDRDICMGAYTKGETFSTLRVRDAMASEVHHCSPADTLEDALNVMARFQVRRIPVVDDDQLLVVRRALHALDDRLECALLVEDGHQDRELHRGTLIGPCRSGL